MRLGVTRAFCISVTAAALAACATGPDIRTDYDQSADFSRYHTFAFMGRSERGVARNYDTISERRVIAAVKREMEARGYREDNDNPDLLVNFATSLEEVQEIRSVPGPTMWPGWYHWRGPYYYPWPAYGYETYVDQYERGSLYIDLVDNARRQLVWEGRATSRVTGRMRDDPAAALDMAVTEIFARYPFRAGPAR